MRVWNCLSFCTWLFVIPVHIWQMLYGVTADISNACTHTQTLKNDREWEREKSDSIASTVDFVLFSICPFLLGKRFVGDSAAAGSPAAAPASAITFSQFHSSADFIIRLINVIIERLKYRFGVCLHTKTSTFYIIHMDVHCSANTHTHIHSLSHSISLYLTLNI